MDNKIKLNSKMNFHIAMTDLWIDISRFGTMIADYATKRAMKHIEANVGIANEMVKENYPDAFKTDLEEVIKGVEL